MATIKRLLVVLFAFFAFFIPVNLFLTYGYAPTVDVTVTGIFDATNSVIINQDANLSGRTWGNKLQLSDKFTPPEGYTFVHWIVNGVVRPELSLTHQFTTTTNMDIKAVFAPSDKYAVIFIDSNGKLINTQYVDKTGTADVISPSTDSYTKPGLTIVDPKWKTSDGITSLNDITSHRVYLLQYQPLGSSSYNLTVNNGAAQSYAFNDIVTVTAEPTSGGVNFSHWAEGAVIVSYQRTYSFTMSYNRSLTAVYAASVTPIPLVTMSNKIDIRTNFDTFIAQFELPAGHELIEHGFLISSTSISSSLSLDSFGNSTIAQSSVYQPLTKEYVMSFIETFYSIKAYVVSQDGETTTTTYSSYIYTKSPIINNSDFSNTGWRPFTNDWDGSIINSAIINGEYVISIDKFVTSDQESWKLQLIQDETSMNFSNSPNGVIDLLPNTTYTFSFDAYASEAMNIHPLIISSNNWVNLVAEADRTKALTTTKQTFTATVTTGAEVFGNEILKFEFGDAFASFDGTPKTVTFDNIVVKDSAEAAVTTVYNGTFDQVLGGYTLYSEGNGTLTSDGSAAVINVTSVGGAAYVPHFYYTIPTLAAGDYSITFTIASTVTRDLRLNLLLPDQNYASILDEYKYDFRVQADGTLTVEVDFSTTTLLNNVKIELDFGTLGGELVSIPGVFTIDNIKIYPSID